MKIKFRVLTCILILPFLFSASYCQEAKKPTVAISDLTGKGVSGMEASVVSDFFRDALLNTGAYQLVERSSMEQVLAEQKFQMSGCTSDECAVKMGKLLNVNRIILGSLSKLGEKYYISVRMVNVEQGKIVVADTVSAESLDLIQGACMELANRIATGKKGPAPTRTAAPTPTAKPEGDGTLVIRSSPKGADVLINDESKGKSPLEIKLPAGSYNVKLKKGERYWENTVPIIINEKTRVTANLKIAPGTLDLKTTPEGAQVYIGGNPIGRTPLKQTITRGTYKIKILMKGYKVYKSKIQMVSNKVTPLDVTLIKKTVKPKIPNKFGIGLHVPGFSLRWFTGGLTFEFKASGGDNVSAGGLRLYINFNPRSKAIVYMGGEFDGISGETELQKFGGAAVGGFLGMEFFANKHMSVLFDIGQYMIHLDSEYEGITAEGSSLVGHVGFNYYF